MLFDYDTHGKMVSSWGEKHKFPLPPKDVLPKVGYVVNDTAVGFLYQTDSRLGWIEWVFSNPSKTKEQRQAALDQVFTHLEAKAKQLKMVVLFSAATNDAFQTVLSRNGFIITDQSVHNIKMLGQE